MGDKVKLKEKLALLLFVVLVLVVFPAGVHAAGGYVNVVLPSFKVTLNGTVIENETSRYPLLVYKDITYFPMTYFDCRFLGLESVWDNENGLKIAQTGLNWEYRGYPAGGRNNKSYRAAVATFAIEVNGKKIDNAREEYPLLVFRDVTYFPLTWRFAVEEFGWEYSFDEKNGLAIYSAPTKLVGTLVSLPVITLPGGAKGAFTAAGNYYYYQGENGVIYQVPADNPSARREVYRLPENEYAITMFGASLYTDNGRAILTYHVGGATMGTDYVIWLKDDGTTEVLDRGYSAVKFYDDYTVRVDQWVPPFTGNL